MDIKKENGKILEELLKQIGPENTSISTESEWSLNIYYLELNEDSTTIEMCLKTNYQGDTLVDPFMKIELIKDESGKIVSANPLHYMSRTMFYEEEIYSKDNPDCWNPKLYEKAEELDTRLNKWLINLKVQGYLTKGNITKI